MFVPSTECHCSFTCKACSFRICPFFFSSHEADRVVVCLSPALSVIAASHAKHVPFGSARLYRPRGWKRKSDACEGSSLCMASCASCMALACRCSTRGYCNKKGRALRAVVLCWAKGVCCVQGPDSVGSLTKPPTRSPHVLLSSASAFEGCPPARCPVWAPNCDRNLLSHAFNSLTSVLALCVVLVLCSRMSSTVPAKRPLCVLRWRDLRAYWLCKCTARPCAQMAACLSMVFSKAQNKNKQETPSSR